MSDEHICDETNLQPVANKEQNKEKDNKKPRGTKVTPWYTWGIKIFVLSFVLTVIFSFLTEIIMAKNSFWVCLIVLVVLLFFNIVFDVFGTATTSCDLQPFLAMASRKKKGAKRAVWLVKNAHKVSSICSDVIGDICGIISGSAGATMALILALGEKSNLIASIGISAAISAFTVGGKAFSKFLAIKYNQKIVYFFAKLLVKS